MFCHLDGEMSPLFMSRLFNGDVYFSDEDLARKLQEADRADQRETQRKMYGPFGSQQVSKAE